MDEQAYQDVHTAALRYYDHATADAIVQFARNHSLLKGAYLNWNKASSCAVGKNKNRVSRRFVSLHDSVKQELAFPESNAEQKSKGKANGVEVVARNAELVLAQMVLCLVWNRSTNTLMKHATQARDILSIPLRVAQPLSEDAPWAMAAVVSLLLACGHHRLREFAAAIEERLEHVWVSEDDEGSLVFDHHGIYELLTAIGGGGGEDGLGAAVATDGPRPDTPDEPSDDETRTVAGSDDVSEFTIAASLRAVSCRLKDCALSNGMLLQMPRTHKPNVDANADDGNGYVARRSIGLDAFQTAFLLCGHAAGTASLLETSIVAKLRLYGTDGDAKVRELASTLPDAYSPVFMSLSQAAVTGGGVRAVLGALRTGEWACNAPAVARLPSSVGMYGVQADSGVDTPRPRPLAEPEHAHVHPVLPQVDADVPCAKTDPEVDSVPPGPALCLPQAPLLAYVVGTAGAQPAGTAGAQPPAPHVQQHAAMLQLVLAPPAVCLTPGAVRDLALAVKETLLGDSPLPPARPSATPSRFGPQTHATSSPAVSLTPECMREVVARVAEAVRDAGSYATTPSRRRGSQRDRPTPYGRRSRDAVPAVAKCVKCGLSSEEMWLNVKSAGFLRKSVCYHCNEHCDAGDIPLDEHCQLYRLTDGQDRHFLLSTLAVSLEGGLSPASAPRLLRYRQYSPEEVQGFVRCAEPFFNGTDAFCPLSCNRMVLANGVPYGELAHLIPDAAKSTSPARDICFYVCRSDNRLCNDSHLVTWTISTGRLVAAQYMLLVVFVAIEPAARVRVVNAVGAAKALQLLATSVLGMADAEDLLETLPPLPVGIEQAMKEPDAARATARVAQVMHQARLGEQHSRFIPPPNAP